MYFFKLPVHLYWTRNCFRYLSCALCITVYSCQVVKMMCCSRCPLVHTSILITCTFDAFGFAILIFQNALRYLISILHLRLIFQNAAQLQCTKVICRLLTLLHLPIIITITNPFQFQCPVVFPFGIPFVQSSGV
jgi:hypothetical protein